MNKISQLSNKLLKDTFRTITASRDLKYTKNTLKLLSPLSHVFLFFSYILTAAFVVPLPPLLSNPNSVHVCCIIFASHFSFGSGGGVPAIGCGLGLVTAFRLVVFVDRRGPDVDVADGAPKPVDVAVAETKILCIIILQHSSILSSLRLTKQNGASMRYRALNCLNRMRWGKPEAIRLTVSNTCNDRICLTTHMRSKQPAPSEELLLKLLTCPSTNCTFPKSKTAANTRTTSKKVPVIDAAMGYCLH
uniref:Uncharacterized protein n=1 Tax=Glossina pallidipes TaxID=7398 RepID=A0A1A9ZD70_GLOPL